MRKQFAVLGLGSFGRSVALTLESMGCGIGACLVCACQLEKEGKSVMGHVCKDGPVFPAEEVVW